MGEESPAIDSIFLTALEKGSAEEQAAYLDSVCGEDVQLRQRVERLLEAYPKAAASFLESPPSALQGAIDVDPAGLNAGLAATFNSDAAVVVGGTGHSVLKSLSKRLPRVPQVTLNESEEDRNAIVQPGSKEMPDKQDDERYQLLGEIARGGMGAIIKGRDTDLGRDLAIKVLLDSHKDKPEVIQRFVEEAQIGGQLQHPGIVPVYELGQFRDSRPFFSMKLVKGETLAHLLAKRKDPGDDLPKLLGIFDQVCQTMAYAHSKRVIHRDLKPANIMVGAFGEVQVMDWGLAKVLGAGGVEDERKSLEKHRDVSVIQTRRSAGSDLPREVGSQTQLGSVLGTPAYMPPEQALGEIDRLDERADVFGLGAILCEILTGKPPYVAENGAQVIRLASRGRLDECLTRLDESGVDQELTKLATESLASEPEERLCDAGELSERMAKYLTGVQDRLKESEVARARAQTRRKLSVGIAALMLTIAVGAAVTAVRFRQQREREAALTLEATEARDAEQKKGEQLQQQLRTATVNRLAAQSQSIQDDLPIVSTLLAVEAVKAGRQKDGSLMPIALEALMNASSRLEGIPLFGHEAAITALAVDPDGRLVATGSADGTTRLWRVRGPDAGDTLVLTGHSDAISFVGFSSNRRWLVTASLDSDARVWDLESLDIPHSARVLHGHTERIKSAAISQDGRWLATASYDGTARIWDLNSTDPGSAWRELTGHSDRVHRIAISPDNRWVITAGYIEDPRILLWDLELAGKAESGNLLAAHVLRKGSYQEPVEHMTVSSDGDWLATSHGVWRLVKGASPVLVIDPVSQHSVPHVKTAVSPDSRLLATSGAGITLLWNLGGTEISAPVRRLPGAGEAAFSSDGRWLFVTRERAGDLWDLNSGRATPTSLHGHDGPINVAAFSPDSRLLVTGSRDRSVRLWDLSDEGFGSPILFPGAAAQLELSPDGRWLAIFNRGLTRLARWNSDTGSFSDAAELKGPQRGSSARSFSPNSRWLAVGSQTKAHLWDLRSPDPHSAPIELPGHENFVTGVPFTPDSRWLATGCADGSLRIWDLESEDAEAIVASRRVLRRHEAMIGNRCVAISPDGRWLATGDFDSKVSLWNLANLAIPPKKWIAHGGKKIAEVRFTPNGRWLVTVGGDNTARLWDPKASDPHSTTHTLSLTSGAIQGWQAGAFLAIAPDGGWLFAGGQHGVVLGWKLSADGPSEFPIVLEGQHEHFGVLAFSPDSRWLFTGGSGIRRWDLHLEEPSLSSLVLRPQGVNSMVVSKDGRWLITSGRDGVKLWDFDTNALLERLEVLTGRALSPKERSQYLFATLPIQ